MRSKPSRSYRAIAAALSARTSSSRLLAPLRAARAVNALSNRVPTPLPWADGATAIVWTSASGPGTSSPA